MARTIVVNFQGTASTFQFSKVDRAKLYGRRLRQPLDPDGRRCSRAELTEDGWILLKRGMAAQAFFDEDKRWIPNADLVGLDKDGAAVPQVKSTLGVGQDLEGPVPVVDYLDLRVQTVYALDPDGLDPALQAALEKGQIFRFPFNYRTDYRPEVGYLLTNDAGTFAIIGWQTEPSWCELETPPTPEFDDDDDLDDDDLDFEMF